MWRTLLPLGCMLLGAVCSGRMVYPPLDPHPVVSNSLHSLYTTRQEEWRPVEEELAIQGGRSGSGEPFASAPPPSILGSLSVFGHATVHARQPARRLPRPPHDSPPRRTSDRPPPPRLPYQDAYTLRGREPHPHSSALTPNSFYFETPQPFQAEPARRAVYKHYPYRLGGGLPLPSGHLYNDPFSRIPQPPPHASAGLSYEDHSKTPSKPLPFFPRSPFGDIRLGSRRPEPPAQQVYDQYAHLGRPFQGGSFMPSNGPLSYEPYAPLVTTFSSPPKYHPEEPATSARPDYVVTRQPYNDDHLPITVTTIDVPSDGALPTGKPVKESFFEDLIPTKSHWDSSVQKPSTFKTYEEQFLPTPPSFQISMGNSHLAVEEPTVHPEEITDYPTTEHPDSLTRQRFKNRRRPGNKYHESNKDAEDNRDYQKNEQKRRRKPIYRGNSAYDRLRNPDFKKRTTTTTEIPDIYEPTIYADYTTSLPSTDEAYTVPQLFTTDPPPAREIEVESEPAFILPVEEEPINEVIQPLELPQIEDQEPTLPPTTTTPLPITTTATATTSFRPEAITTPSRLKVKYGNRPRFSVKDYRDRLNRGSSTTHSPEELLPKKEVVKIPPPRIRGSSQFKNGVAPTSSGVPETETEGRRKYKPRQGPSRYRSTTTSTPQPVTSEATSTTDRVNTFRPSTNRYKPGKYYSRYRTTTPSGEADEVQPTRTTVASMRPKGVFSAKRRPFPLKGRPGDDEGENEVAPATLFVMKLDTDGTTPSTTTTEEAPAPPPALSDLSIVDSLSDPTGLEAMRIADLTSSPSNEFKTAGFHKSTPSTRRNLPKISFTTDEPILPLEAFFQTHSKDRK